MELVKIGIEFSITLIIIFGIYYFSSIKNIKKRKNYVSKEVNLILSFYKIDYHKINLKQMTFVVALFTSIFLSISITIVSHWNTMLVWSLIIATLISLLGILAVYSLIGNYYLRQSLKKEVKRKK